MPWGVSLSGLVSAVMGGDSRLIGQVMQAMHPQTVAFGRRRLLQMIAPSLLRERLSMNRALGLFRGVGVGYRRDDFRKDFTKHGREAVRVADYLSAVKPGESYDMSMARESGDNFANEYTGVAHVNWRDPVTGELHDQYITIAMTEGMTDEDVEARIERDMTMFYRTDGEEWSGIVESWELEDLAYNSDWAEPYAGLF